jgi:N-acetylglucosamine-6-phosphate deacetylase
MPSRTFLTGADLVLPDRVVSGQTLVIEDERIVDLLAGFPHPNASEARVDLSGRVIVPGFVDVHVHGVEGIDSLQGMGAVRAMAETAAMGVSAFCHHDCLRSSAQHVSRRSRRLQNPRGPPGARVLPAHLESNYQPGVPRRLPLACLRVPAQTGVPPSGSDARAADHDFSSADILATIERHRPDVGIVTLAPELDGGILLVRAFVAAGVHVSLGHSGATFDLAQTAIAAGARQATHLFHRMSAMSHRDPGLTGAVLSSDEVAAELVCDGHHVHPAVMRGGTAKGVRSGHYRGTAGSGLPSGATAELGGYRLTVKDVARYDDGTIAGSVVTMDRVFACLVATVGLDLIGAAQLCSTTPARELGLHGHGVIAPGAVADLTVLNANLEVDQTWVGGKLIFQNE